MQFEQKIVARNHTGIILWCQKSKEYTIRFDDMALFFTPNGFMKFKDVLHDCYADHKTYPIDKTVKFITFKTHESDVDFQLSLNDVADILSLIQMTGFQQFAIEKLDLKNVRKDY